MQRTIRYFYCAVIALLALSCDKVSDDTPVKNVSIVIPESISAKVPTFETKTQSFQGGGLIEDVPESWDGTETVETRTYAVVDEATIDPNTGEAGEYYQYWSEGDAISLFFTRANLKYVMQGYIGSLDIGEFLIEGEPTEGGKISTGYYYSVYPYKESTSISAKGKVTYEFPKTQHYSGDTYSDDENGMIARALPEEVPTYEKGVLYFQNFCSYLQLRLVATEGQPTTVKKITLTANDKTILLSGPGQIEVMDASGEPQVSMDREPDVEMKRQGSNQITLDCGGGVELSTDESAPTKFWFVVPGDISFTGGFSVSIIYDDLSYYRKSTQKTIGIQRSHIKPMATFKPVAMQASTPIRYKYNNPSPDDEAFPLKNTFYGEGGVTLDILDQVYDEETGEWVVLLSGTLKTIGDNSFLGPGEKLEYVKVVNEDESVTLSDFAFYNCTADYLQIHSSVDEIKANAFKGSTIADIYIDGSVNSIYSGVSSDSNIEKINITGNVGTIEEKAFHACESLVEVKIGGSVDLIEQEAFESCHNLEIVEITGDIDVIEAKAFNDNDKLHTIDFTGDIDKIGQQAFYDCDALEKFHVKGGVGEIGQEAFAGCDILNFVSVEGNVGTIGNRAFYDSDELVFVDIHGGVGTIGEESFSKMDKLEKVHISGNVETIGARAFHDSDSLHDLLIDGHVDNIKSEAFSSCDGLETVNLYGDVQVIDKKAFYECNSLKKVNITGNVNAIEENAFASCDELHEISVKSVETIGVGAFLGCANLSVVNVPGVKYIEKRAFENCYAIESMNLESVITIDDSAFWACASLTSVIISEYCTMIGEGAFCNASSLAEVYIYAVEPPFIKTDNYDSSYAFAGTHPDLVIYIPAGSIDDYVDDEWFEGQEFDDPAIEAEVNWWFEEYEDYLVEM